MSKRSRTKGHSFERFIANTLRGLFPNARRQLEYHSADCNGVDIMHTGPFKIQCKKLKKYSPITAIEEVKCDRSAGDIPVLVTAGDNLEAMVVLPLSDFIKLLEDTDLDCTLGIA